MNPRVKVGAGSFWTSLSSRARRRRTEIFVDCEISSREMSRITLSRRSSSPKERGDETVIILRPVNSDALEYPMLAPRAALCKNSFRAGFEQDRYPRGIAQSGEVVARGAGQERQSPVNGKPPIAKQGASDCRSDIPSGREGDDLQNRRLPSSGRGHDVRLRDVSVVQKSGDHAWILIQAQRHQRAAADDLRKINSLRHNEFRQSAQKVPIGRPAHLRVDPHGGGEVRESPPEERRDQVERLAPRRPGMGRKRPADGVELARPAVSEDRFEGIGGNISLPQDLEVMTLGAHQTGRFESRERRVKSFIPFTGFRL